MKVLFVFTLLIQVLHPNFVLNLVTPIGNNSQSFCLEQLPKNTAASQTFEAMICGKNPTDTQIRDSLIASGLFHLFVVSGSHLTSLILLLEHLSLPLWLIRAIALIYVFFTGAQPPAVRGFVFTLLPQKRPHDLKVLWAGLICIFIFPPWINSKSLLLSWSFSLFCLSSPFMTFLFTAPLLWGWGNLHPVTMVYNVVLGFLAGGVLLPLLVLACILPCLLPITEKTIQVFFWICEKGLHFQSPNTLLNTSLSNEVLVVYLLLIHVLWHALRINHFRQKIFFSRSQ